MRYAHRSGLCALITQYNPPKWKRRKKGGYAQEGGLHGRRAVGVVSFSLEAVKEPVPPYVERVRSHSLRIMSEKE
jgi:hypothetical protein